MITTRAPTGQASADHTRAVGVLLAGVTACISGVAVFVNAYGVRRFPDPTTYTTAKNLVATVLLTGLLIGATRRGSSSGLTVPRDHRGWWGLIAVGVIGGSVPFVLFFEGLARASSTDAAILHKTLVVWVALLAVPLLHERIGPPHLAAIGLLVAGQVALASHLSTIRLDAGETMILVATLLWALEVVVAKRLLAQLSPLTVGAARMGVGVGLLLAWQLARGELSALSGLSVAAWGWAILTGVVLCAYVATWFSALARAQAVDVTAVLVFGAVVTVALDTTVRGAPVPDQAGVALLLVGSVLAATAALRPDRWELARR